MGMDAVRCSVGAVCADQVRTRGWFARKRRCRISRRSGAREWLALRCMPRPGQFQGTWAQSRSMPICHHAHAEINGAGSWPLFVRSISSWLAIHPHALGATKGTPALHVRHGVRVWKAKSSADLVRHSARHGCSHTVRMATEGPSPTRDGWPGRRQIGRGRPI